jgi:hypothetical protein
MPELAMAAVVCLQFGAVLIVRHIGSDTRLLFGVKGQLIGTGQTFWLVHAIMVANITCSVRFW